MENSTKTLTLISADEKRFDLPVAAAVLSGFLKDACNNGEDEDDEDNVDELAGSKEYPPMRVLRVSSAALSKVVDFLTYHHQDSMNKIPMPLGAATFDEVMTQKWYQTFSAEESIPRELLFEVLTAANYMTIKPLLDLCCLRVTFWLKDQSYADILEILNLPELSAEEEEKAREEHAWMFAKKN